MIDGRRAIVTGLMGLDSEHGGYSELHPVYAMAIQTQPSQPGEDTWMIFARNWGGEGFCSGSIFHTLPSAMKEFTIELPIPSATAAVTGADITTDFYSYDTDDCPQVAFVQGKGVVITFNTPMESFPTKPIQRPLIEGEVHVHWLTTGMIQTSPPVSCDPRLQQEFRQDQKDFAKALLGRRLAEKEKTRFFSLETEAVRDYFNPSNLLHCGVSGPGEVGTSILPTPGVSGLTAENSSLGMQRSQYPAARRRLMLRSLHQATIKTRRVGRRR